MFNKDEMSAWKALSDKVDHKFVVAKEAVTTLTANHKINEDQNWREALKAVEMDYQFGRPVLGKILVLPEESALEFRFKKPWACISITSEDNFPVMDSENRIGIIKLRFADRNYDSELSFTEEQAIVYFVGELPPPQGRGLPS